MKLSLTRRHFLGVVGTLLINLSASACAQDLRGQEALSVEVVVQQLRYVQGAIPGARSDGTMLPAEALREKIYDQLLVLSPASVQALAKGFQDPDVEFRRQVALALEVLSGGWWRFGGEMHIVDITAVLPELIAALTDADPTVRGWAAGDIGNIGAGAAVAVPTLIALLTRDDEGPRNRACFALGQIGPAADAALPYLRELSSIKDLRWCTDIAIKRIEGKRR